MQTRIERASARSERAVQQVRDPGVRAEPATEARVSVAWTPANDVSRAHPRGTRIELVTALDSRNRAWTCEQRSDMSWLEAIEAARCSEVVLTAHSGGVPARHLVLELAELLTFRLAATQPLVRVRFLKTPEQPDGAGQRAIASGRRAQNH